VSLEEEVARRKEAATRLAQRDALFPNVELDSDEKFNEWEDLSMKYIDDYIHGRPTAGTLQKIQAIVAYINCEYLSQRK